MLRRADAIISYGRGETTLTGSTWQKIHPGIPAPPHDRGVLDRQLDFAGGR
jgi:hypothetical protein